MIVPTCFQQQGQLCSCSRAPASAEWITATVDREMRGSAVILTHPHKQRGEAKGRSTMADLHSWQPSHQPIIRGNREDGRVKTKERWRMRDCRHMEGKLWFQKVSACFQVASVCVCESLFLSWSKEKLNLELTWRTQVLFVFVWKSLFLPDPMQICLLCSPYLPPMRPPPYICVRFSTALCWMLFTLTEKRALSAV